MSVDGAVEAGNTMRVYALKFHPENEHIFITAGWDNHIKVTPSLLITRLSYNLSGQFWGQA
jgi:hypothetical protein